MGARVSTENIAYDAHTGKVLLTKTANEYRDAYYSMSYPAHWYQLGYSGMDKASINIGMEGEITTIATGSGTVGGFSLVNGGEVSVRNIFHEGDELL